LPLAWSWADSSGETEWFFLESVGELEEDGWMDDVRLGCCCWWWWSFVMACPADGGMAGWMGGEGEEVV